MRRDKEKVLKLRRLGKSYNEIRQEIRIPKSTLSEWLSKSNWSNRIRKTLEEVAKKKSVVRLRYLDKIRGSRLSRVYEEAHREAEEEFKHFKFHPLFITGISIYWGEGDKSSKNNVRLSNIDPTMIRLFARFLREICGVPSEKIRAYILVYPDLNKETCRNFWIKESGLTENNFNKCVTIRGKHKTRRIQYGVCTLGTSSTYLKEKLRVWLELLPKEFSKRNYYPAGIV